MENIGKNLHLALAGPRVAQCVSIDHLGLQDRNIAQNHGLLRNALVPGLATTDDPKKKKSIGDGKESAKCMEMPFDAQLNLLSATESMRSNSSLQVHAPGSTQAHRCDFRAVSVHGLDVSGLCSLAIRALGGHRLADATARRDPRLEQHRCFLWLPSGVIVLHELERDVTLR